MRFTVVSNFQVGMTGSLEIFGTGKENPHQNASSDEPSNGLQQPKAKCFVAALIIV